MFLARVRRESRLPGLDTCCLDWFLALILFAFVCAVSSDPAASYYCSTLIVEGLWLRWFC